MFKQDYKIINDYAVVYTRKHDRKFIVDINILYKIIELNKTWRINTNGYVISDSWDGKKQHGIRLHRWILDYNGNLDIDHINGNRLDNRKDNLRICTRSQNLMNKDNSGANTSGKIGVVFDKSRRKWAARIKINSKHINLGRFKQKGDAILTRLLAEDKYFKEYAYNRTTFKNQIPV